MGSGEAFGGRSEEEELIESTFDELVEEGKKFREGEEAREQQKPTLESAISEVEKARNEELELRREEEKLENINSEQSKILAELEERLEKIDSRRLEVLAELEERLENIDSKQSEVTAKLEEKSDDDAPNLVAINADFTHDKKELAHDLAEIDLNKETADAGFMKKLWKGTLFKKYYQEKYAREYLNAERTQNIEGEELTVNDLINRRKEGAIKRFVMSVVEDESGYIHEKAGEKRVEADTETTEALKGIIEKFASAPENADENNLKLDFENSIKRFEAENPNFKGANNYLEVAMQARSYVLHNMSLGRVMEGFKLYNAEVRDGVRTKAHRDKLDMLIDKFESSKIGQFVPPEILAGAAGVAAALAQTGARAMAGAAGGMLVSSALAGLKERNRLAEDRARFLRDRANGMEYEKGKYNAEIFGTYYDIRKANELKTGLEYAMSDKSENKKAAVLEAIAAARVRIELSDEENKDLIAFSSEDKRGNERLELDIALIQAEKSLSEEERSELDAMKAQIRNTILERISVEDKAFNRKRAEAALKKAGKTFALGLATFFTSQEIIAAIDPNKIGIFEKAGIIKTNEGATEETLLASSFGFKRGTFDVNEVTESVSLRADQEIEIDQLTREGYTKTLVKEGWVEDSGMPNSVQELSPESFADRLHVKYDGWANNGTGIADGNELKAYLSNGQIVSDMQGSSVTIGNEMFEYNDLAAAGKIKGYLTIGNTKFEIASQVNEAGQLTWANNGVFTTTSGETIKAIGDNGEKLYKYFEIAMDNGADDNGIQHIIPFATDVGRNTFDGVVEKAIAEPIEHPAIYELTKITANQFPRTVTGTGIVFAPETARTGLGGPTSPDKVEK